MNLLLRLRIRQTPGEPARLLSAANMSSGNDTPMTRFLFAILQQKCLKDVSGYSAHGGHDLSIANGWTPLDRLE